MLYNHSGVIDLTVTFCGHRTTQNTPELRTWLDSCVEKLIREGADTFYLGGYGDFDRIAASVVWTLKEKYGASADVKETGSMI